ncbi:MAG: alpha/beta hydrolase family protein [Gemmataceae bacterium]
MLSLLVVMPAAGPWDLTALKNPPAMTELSRGQTRQILYEGEPYRGKPTRIWAYLAFPEKTEGKRPAMVLVHGGGGTAFREWAELWAKRGYVALAMDLAGHGPDGKRLPDGGPNQGDADKFFFKGDIRDFWTYHAVAAVIRGVSLLGSLPEVDSGRIGITGISWGGYLTSIVAGLDDRLKVAVPVYGCGHIHENSAWNSHFRKLSPEDRHRWVDNFEPSRYLANARMPVLWVNGTNDFAYPLDSYQKSYRLTPDRTLTVTVRMPHGHPQGWAPVEIGRFVDQHLKKGPPLPRIRSCKREGQSVEMLLDAKTPIRSCALHFTTDQGPWQKRDWKSVSLKVEGDRVKAILPEGRPLVYFLTATDESKATVSTEHEVLEK